MKDIKALSGLLLQFGQYATLEALQQLCCAIQAQGFFHL